jgi:glutamate synthase (ferredoxin)
MIFLPQDDTFMQEAKQVIENIFEKEGLQVLVAFLVYGH